MAESQLLCMDDSPAVFEKVPESKARFYYSEPQRLALEKLLAQDERAYRAALEGEHAQEFLSVGEIGWIRNTFRPYDFGKEPKKKDKKDKERKKEDKKKEAASQSEANSGPRSTYWPQMSDTEVPTLDLGWAEGARYKGATRVMVYTHPPKESEPVLIREAARKLIQESRKVGVVPRPWSSPRNRHTQSYNHKHVQKLGAPHDRVLLLLLDSDSGPRVWSHGLDPDVLTALVDAINWNIGSGSINTGILLDRHL
ncbi:hypothetical protein Z043_125985 [Scleropages formosus]|uniref:Scaffolding anchor of CK1 domain-containing protein n=1 Tax=Scleropages formosus TaxID=113540 RepID=A0A0P7W1B7_SCLFO|nr:hypothetical protein Z043_125985 [Scleropages formosus]